MSRLASCLSHALLAVLFLAMPGCIQKFGPIVTRPPTLGEELLSLDAAHEEGLLTDAEFATRRAQTIAVWKAIGTAPVEVPEEDDAP
ncbi:MAG: hypothetical protein ACK5WD_05295 [bacterium]|jgi:hypothetical protein